MKLIETGIQSFATAIGLADDWPTSTASHESMDCAGHLTWAETYFRAAELLHSQPREPDGFALYCGPVMQIVGLSTELTLKCLLRGGGKSERSLRGYSHNTYNAYLDSRENFDEVKFINLAFSNTDHLIIPDEIRARLELRGEPDPDRRWRVYFDHLRILDTVYDRPYRNRYLTPGHIVLPEVEIILVGTKILLSAMRERL